MEEAIIFYKKLLGLIQNMGVTDETILAAVTKYLDDHPEYVGATTEQAQDINNLKKYVGNLQNLSTEEKDTLVNAINEVLNKCRMTIQYNEQSRKLSYVHVNGVT